jgi:predicted metal-dependent peptidase
MLKNFTPLERMVKARIQLLMHQPFFGTLAMRLKLIEAPKGPSNPYGTMATDGRMISFSPDFLAKISDKEIEGVIAHEVMHVALKHHLRRRTREAKKWNVACLAGDTPVLMADNSERPIRSVRPGDFVASPFGPNRVLALKYSGVQQTVELDFLGRLVISTQDHLFATPEGFIRAEAFAHQTSYGFATRQLGSNPVRRGELLNDVAEAAQRGDGVLLHGNRGASTEARSPREAVNYEAAEHGALPGFVGPGSGLHRWDHRRGGNAFGLSQEHRLLAAYDLGGEHFDQVAGVVGGEGFLLVSGHEHGRPAVVPVLHDGLADRAYSAAVSAISRDQEAARASVTASREAADAAAISRATDALDAGYRGASPRLELARGQVSARAGEHRAVYDLVTEFGVLFANGILTHNCDATINCDLTEAGFELPKPRIDMPEHKGKAAETIYNELPDNEGGDGGGGDEWGVVLDDPQAGGSESEQAEAENEVNIMVAQAAQAQEKHDKAKGRGTTPAWMKRLIEKALEPEVKWQDVMRRFVSERVPHDRTWARINRRFAHAGLYLPGNLKKGLGEVVALFDTSGSITQKMLTRIYSECNALFVDCEPEKLHAMACDAAVGNFVTFEDEPQLAPDMFVGGGGSDFRPAFAKIKDLGINPVCCLVFSDMDIAFPDKAPGYPVLCISTTERKGPDWATEHVRVRDC